MNKKFLTEEEVEKEIERLKKDEFVALARKAERIKYKRRQVLYNLRDLEKKGKSIAQEMAKSEIDDLETFLMGEESYDNY